MCLTCGIRFHFIRCVDCLIHDLTQYGMIQSGYAAVGVHLIIEFGCCYIIVIDLVYNVFSIRLLAAELVFTCVVNVISADTGKGDDENTDKPVLL